MHITEQKSTTALSARGGMKRTASFGDESISKRPRIENVTKLFAADHKQVHSSTRRKRPRNRNSAMRDLLTQSRATMIQSQSKEPTNKRAGSVSRHTLSSHSGRRSTTTSNGPDLMEVDHLSSSAQDGSAVRSPAHAPSESVSSISQRFTLNHNPGAAYFHHATPQEQGSARYGWPAPQRTIVVPGLPSNKAPSYTATARDKLYLVTEDGLPSSLREPSGNRTRKRGSTTDPVDVPGRDETSSMPKWLVQTLSELPAGYPLAAPRTSPLSASDIEHNDASEGSPLLSIHASTSSLEYSRGKISHPTQIAIKHPPGADKHSPRQECSSKEEDEFAFHPPPLAPERSSHAIAPLVDTTGHKFVTSTPPWRTTSPLRSLDLVPEDRLQNTEHRARPSNGSTSSLFDSSIQPIPLLRQANAGGRPHTPFSYFTASPPSSAYTAASDIAIQKGMVPSANLTQWKPADEREFPGIQAEGRDIYTPPDFFGATWAMLQRSLPPEDLTVVKPIAQQRFFFANSVRPRLHKPILHPVINTPSHTIALQPEPSLWPSIGSFTTTASTDEYPWAPSFPEAKIPNHRYAPLPTKSQLRNNFLGAPNPLVTTAAIEEATAAANRNSTRRKALDSAELVDASIHVHFRTPAQSYSLSLSDKDESGLLEHFPSVQSLQLDRDLAVKVSQPTSVADDMRFFREQPRMIEPMRFMDESGPDQPLTQSQSHPAQATHASCSERAINVAGIDTEEDSLWLPEADIGEEVDIHDDQLPIHGEGEQYHDAEEQRHEIDGNHSEGSHDSLCSWSGMDG